MSGFGTITSRTSATQVVAGAEKLAQRAPRRREGVELCDGQPVLVVGAAEVREAAMQRSSTIAGVDRRVDGDARP